MVIIDDYSGRGVAQSKTPVTPTNSGGVTFFGWVLGAVVLIGLYQYSGTRSIAVGVIALIILGLSLRFEPTIQSQFSKVF